MKEGRMKEGRMKEEVAKKSIEYYVSLIRLVEQFFTQALRGGLSW